MADLRSDTLLFLRLAGSRSGVSSRHVPLTVIDVVSNLGGCVRFGVDRIYVDDHEKIGRRLVEIFGATCG